MKRTLTAIFILIVAFGCKKQPADDKPRERIMPGTVETYQWARSLRPSNMYDVTVNGETQMVLTTEEPHFCSFGCTDTVRVVVDLLSALANEVTVRPVNKNVEYRLREDHRLELYMAPCDRYVVEFNGSDQKPLFLFANPPERKPAREDCSFYYEAGKVYDKQIDLSSGNIYIEGGAWVNGQIHIQNAQDVTVRGYGVLYGVGGDKPMFINKSRNVSVDGIVLINHDFWSTLAAQSETVSFNNYKVIAPASSNEQGHENDALDILGCTNVRIDKCFTYCHDDALCIKSEKWLYKGKVEDVRAEDCVIWNVKCGTTLEIGVELNQDCSDVHFKDIYCVHSGGGMNNNLYRAGIGIKQTAGGRLSGFTFENIYVEDAREFGIYLGIYKSSASIGNDVEYSPGIIDGVTFRNIYIDGPASYGNVARGYDSDTHKIKNVTFENLFRNGKKVTDLNTFFTTRTNADITLL